MWAYPETSDEVTSQLLDVLYLNMNGIAGRTFAGGVLLEQVFIWVGS